jgi:hypothetical protein
VCRFLSRSLSFGIAVDGRQWEVQTLSDGFYARAHRWCRVSEAGFHLYGEVNTLVTLSCTLLLKCPLPLKLCSIF